MPCSIFHGSQRSGESCTVGDDTYDAMRGSLAIESRAYRPWCETPPHGGGQACANTRRPLARRRSIAIGPHARGSPRSASRVGHVRATLAANAPPCRRRACRSRPREPLYERLRLCQRTVRRRQLRAVSSVRRSLRVWSPRDRVRRGLRCETMGAGVDFVAHARCRASPAENLRRVARRRAHGAPQHSAGHSEYATGLAVASTQGSPRGQARKHFCSLTEKSEHPAHRSKTRSGFFTLTALVAGFSSRSRRTT